MGSLGPGDFSVSSAARLPLPRRSRQFLYDNPKNDLRSSAKKYAHYINNGSIYREGVCARALLGINRKSYFPRIVNVTVT